MLLDAGKAERLQLFGDDSCDLVRTIEDSFGVTLSEDDLARATSIGALSHTVFVKLDRPISPRCLSAITFYQFRRAFVDLFGISRGKISPGTCLRVSMPWQSRKRRWRQVQDHLDYVLPQLIWPSWLLAVWLALVGISLYFFFSSRLFKMVGGAGVLVGIVGVIVVLSLAAKFLNPLGRHFPKNCETFGDLVKLALARNYGKIATACGTSSEKEVAQLLLQLVAAEISISIDALSTDTSFPEGLGIY